MKNDSPLNDAFYDVIKADDVDPFESAIMENMRGTLERGEYRFRDMPEGTVITAPYYTDLNVLVTLK